MPKYIITTNRLNTWKEGEIIDVTENRVECLLKNGEAVLYEEKQINESKPKKTVKKTTKKVDKKNLAKLVP